MPSKKSGSRGQLRARMETCSADVDKFVAHIGKLVDHERESCKITAAFVADLAAIAISMALHFLILYVPSLAHTFSPT